MIASRQLAVGYASNGEESALLENLNLQLKEGELVCFMGPNGIGKSTLLRTLAGLQKPLRGELKGIEKGKLSLVLTDRITATNMLVYDLVAYGRYPHLSWNISLRDEDHRIIEEAISLTQIGHLKNKRLYQLSDGQMQLVMIARALAQQTPVMLLDEPTAHLDLNNRVEIMNLLRKLARQERKAILVCTHELDLALQTADWIWLATLNKKVVSGIPEDLVLNGAFDEVFQFKGFDLKTGKVEHEAHRNKPIQLIGEGYPFLWTKNALERCGYEVTANAETIIKIQTEQTTIWQLQDLTLKSVSDLLAALAKK
ncbi:MAG: ABC transporter ATP-binding protein [Bacteroidetes bacterium]|nr:ABC transporter ATP-binding protein [Bacteroidota bacterium]